MIFEVEKRVFHFKFVQLSHTLVFNEFFSSPHKLQLPSALLHWVNALNSFQCYLLKVSLFNLQCLLFWNVLILSFVFEPVTFIMRFTSSRVTLRLWGMHWLASLFVVLFRLLLLIFGGALIGLIFINETKFWENIFIFRGRFRSFLTLSAGEELTMVTFLRLLGEYSFLQTLAFLPYQCWLSYFVSRIFTCRWFFFLW